EPALGAVGPVAHLGGGRAAAGRLAAEQPVVRESSRLAAAEQPVARESSPLAVVPPVAGLPAVAEQPVVRESSPLAAGTLAVAPLVVALPAAVAPKEVGRCEPV